MYVVRKFITISMMNMMSTKKGVELDHIRIQDRYTDKYKIYTDTRHNHKNIKCTFTAIYKDIPTKSTMTIGSFP